MPTTSVGSTDYEDAEVAVRDGLALSRRVGSRYWEWSFLGQIYPFFALGKWDEALSMMTELPEEQWSEARQAFGAMVSFGVALNAQRGALAEADRLVRLFDELGKSADVQERASYNYGKSRLLIAQRKPTEALAAAEAALEARDSMGLEGEFVKESIVAAIEAAFEASNDAKVEEFLGIIEGLPRGRYPHFLRAQAMRFRAGLAARGDDADRAEQLFKGAAGLFRELAIPFYLAVTQLESAEWLLKSGRSEEEGLLTEAREIFERLGATPWLERAAQATGIGQQAEAVT